MSRTRATAACCGWTTEGGQEDDRLRGVEPGTEFREWSGEDWGVLVEGLDQPGGLLGIEIGPDEHMWIVDHATPAILRIDP